MLYDRIREKLVMRHSTQKQHETPSPTPANPPRKRESSAHRWPKKLLAPIARVLRTGDPTDTVDRLFDSRHVNDLRLIAATAFVLMLLVFVVALIAAVSFCWAAWTPAATATLPGLIVFLAENGGVHFLAVFAPILAVFGAILAWAYQVGSARLGVVDLFACEIDTLSRVTVIVGMVKNLVDRYSHRQSQPAPAAASPPIPTESFNSQENYFPILDSNARDLQTLEANVVINITAFYTYMKAVRDAFRRIADSQNGDRQHEALKNLIYMLYLALESGRRATDDLVEFEPTHAERTLTTLLSELDAYTFLRGQYTTPNEVHHDRLILRGPQYIELVKRLNELLRHQGQALLRSVQSDATHYPSDEVTQWSAALQSLPALNARFDALRAQFSLDCTRMDNHITIVASSSTEPERLVSAETRPSKAVA
jgi:hypothetical protein